MANLDAVAEIFVTLSQVGAQLGNRLTEPALFLLTGVTAIIIAWRFATGLLAGRAATETLVEVIFLGIEAAAIAWILTNYAYATGEFVAGFDWIAQKLAGTEARNIIRVVISQITLVAYSLWDSLAGAKATMFWAVIAGPTAAIPIVLKLATILVTILVGAVIGAMAFVSQFLIMIALAVGPIFLPTRIVPQLSQYYAGWERFLVSAALIKVIGVVMLAAITALAQVLQMLANNLGVLDAAVVDLEGTMLLSIVAALMLYMSWQIPGIAQGLVSGSALVRTPTPTSALTTANRMSQLAGRGGGGSSPATPVPAIPIPVGAPRASAPPGRAAATKPSAKPVASPGGTPKPPNVPSPTSPSTPSAKPHIKPKIPTP